MFSRKDVELLELIYEELQDRWHTQEQLDRLENIIDKIEELVE